MTRFQLWPRPNAYPFFDIVTRDTDPGPVFDLSVELDGYDGPVYLKPEHVREMARTLGMADKETVDAILAENQRLNGLVNALPEEAKVLEDGLATLVANFHDRLSTRANSTDVPVVDEEPDETAVDNVDSDESAFLEQLDTDSGANKASGQSDDNSSVERPASVRSGSKSSRTTL